MKKMLVTEASHTAAQQRETSQRKQQHWQWSYPAREAGWAPAKQQIVDLDMEDTVVERR